ncbi:MAG TPA: YifB family Mg chelatase-like AAA ATPase [Candidatus Saccharimonadales bacterium]|nr:YifB family Mg chelatase-like AAA ATPase [Candidatus Saccharimonadales bacterium]
MNHTARSILVAGMDGIPVDIECQLSNGLPTIVIVGLGSRAIDEAKERIRSAFASTKLALPRKRITINLAPADVRKESTSFDLAIAAAIICSCSNKLSIDPSTAIIGEVGLSGLVRPVRGIIGKLIAGKRLGFKKFFIPYGNLEQAALVPGVTLFAVKDLKQFYQSLQQPHPAAATNPAPKITMPSNDDQPSLSDITGQEHAKRAIAIAAAGGHNILLYGPPGTGKSMLAKALPGLLPPLSHQEMLEVTHLHSLASQRYDRLITSRPFRAPHHSSSSAAIIGGGPNTSPGELSLSHRGVFFMDELPEFDRRAIEALRQPLEDRTVTVTRLKQTINYPANFILAATANPCPCGFYGSRKECSCTPSELARYQRKLSGPLLDRIDLFVCMELTNHALLLSPQVNAMQTIRTQIVQTRTIQQRRFGDECSLNASMSNAQIKTNARLSKEATAMLNVAAEKLELSPRAYMRTIRVSRTIADLENSKMILAPHIAESLQYRKVRFTHR